MRVLVTGGAGYIGSVTVGQLLKQGHQVRTLDCLMYGGSSLLGFLGQEGFEFIHGDIRLVSDLEKSLKGVDAVVHLAAIVGDPACARKPDLAHEINKESSLTLLRLCRRYPIQKFIFASTCSNYGRAKEPGQLTDENEELRPVSLYAKTKVEVEKAILSNGDRTGPWTTILRFATVFGISPRMRFDLTVNEFTLELLTKRKITVYGQQFWRPYIHVQDAARAIAIVLNSPSEKMGGRVFNIGDTNENYQKGKLAELIRKQLECPDLSIEYIHKEDDPRDYRVSFERARKELDFKISRTVRDGVLEIKDAIGNRVFSDFDNPRYRN